MKRLVLLGFALTLTLSADEPRLEPLRGLPPFPADNPPTPEKIRLGKDLFFEEMLSGDGRRSCASCHKPELYFTDGFSRAWGLNEMELRRKTPTVLNVGWQRSMFFDSRVETLEEQVSKPLENPLEMNLDLDEAVRRVAADRYYQRLFDEAFPGEEITFELISKAVASYERTLVSVGSALDRYLLGDGAALEAEAKRGMELFTGRAGCIRCHNGPMLTDHQRHYTGVREELGDNRPGTPYKTQSLRDVMRRYSYMHNGSLLTMRAVLDHYARGGGGGGGAPEGLETEIEPVELSEEDRADLTAFLMALSGDVDALLDDSPAATGRFSSRNRRRAAAAPMTADEEAEASDIGPVTDPNYVKKPKR